jgi:regulator of sigma E protease
MITLYGLMVLIGVNMIILAHEWGHFVVARLCGVKCEKFYVWFDIFGWRICRFRWGDTEYGLGVLPLGGYVKMLGQEDKPARLREELERAKAARAAGHPFAEAPEAPAAPGANPSPSAGASASQMIDVEAAERALYDPQSYLAQSVPKRMAIISAGVIMNVLFALVAAMIAYQLGVRQVACAVGAVVPGKGAWQADLQVGDRIVQIAGEPVRTFSDLKSAVSLGDVSEALPMVVRRPGVEEPLRVTVMARPGAIAPEVGIGLPQSTSLVREVPVFPGSPASQARPAFQGGDQVVRIDDQPIASHADVYAQLARHPGRPLKITVKRRAEQPQGPSESPVPAKEVTIDVAPAPMRRLGLVMQMGAIAAIQEHSPAAETALRVGDRILRVDGQPVDDPMTWPDQLRRRANGEGQKRVTLSVAREGENEPVDIDVPLREVDTYDAVVTDDSPVPVPALGIAYRVLNRVTKVQVGSPAAAAGLKADDVIVRALLIPPDKQSLASRGLDETARYFLRKERPMELAEGEDQWPFLVFAIQQSLPGTRVELELADGRTVTLEPVDAADWFNPDRGLLFDLAYVRREADSLGEAVRLGTQETVDALLLIFRTLNKLSTGQVSPKGLIGPVGIVKHAYYTAEEGPGEFLLFLCLISANLAVINFLPIPVLDGGHMIFLAYEGVRGKPPSENVFVGLSYLGLAVILILMIWVISLDFGCIARR